MIPQNYEIRTQKRADIEGDEYEHFNVYCDGEYVFSAFSRKQAENLISKREDALQQAKNEFAAAAFLYLHKDSSYLKYPMTSARSGMGRKG
jgi:hypothetical protein